MTPPPISSRLPTSVELMRTFAHTIVCMAIAAILVAVFVFTCLCILLSRANTPDVRSACPGYWDFMLIAILAPFCVPLLYCALACCFACEWSAFSFASSLVMGIACLQMSLSAGTNASCVEALRRTSEPLPWLIYAGYIKSALFLASAASHLAHALPKPAPPVVLKK